MARIDYLNDQISRAERLAKMIADELTAARLRAFAAECRAELAETEQRGDFAGLRVRAV
ncbi:hypothetical protein LPW26_16935 [Rhodopseudomonas sp. HC1]|uniref:hypothetical protein n=1 Tax=Rhodopseudomonas infernalis TaxID=2897386 RepID=UPI001EE8C82C|nr:hypothetical protein [Rhodopseudomonas infernalis]MCG6206336.1 hypothetical protein [Rhodopseudomonas infernalis]